MTTDRYDENLILGYVENTLTASEKLAFEAQLKIDPQLASLVDMMQQDRLLLNELDQVTAPMELSDYISNQLQRQVLLGPLPNRLKLDRNHRSTPQGRSQFRIMRFGAYGALAAMFLLVAGLMYYYIGNQSLIQRTQNFVLDSQTQNGPVMAMNKPAPQSNRLEQRDKQTAKSTSEVSLKSKADRAMPAKAKTRVAADMGSRKETQLGATASATASRSNELKRVSPTPARLAQAPTPLGHIASNKMAKGLATGKLKSHAIQQSQSLTWADRSDEVLTATRRQKPPSPVAMTAMPAQKQLATSQTLALAKQQMAQPSRTLCLIQSPRPTKTIQSIRQWALRNRVTILTPKIEKLKSTSKDKSEQEKSSLNQIRQVIILNMPASQLPVLIQWLNQQPKQQNRWIQPLAKTRTANISLERLQQELPLIPTIPLIKPKQSIQVQLMVVPLVVPQSKADKITEQN